MVSLRLEPTRVEPVLAKRLGLEEIDSEKHTSLYLYGYNYSRKKSVCHIKLERL
jgi:hypothetical protein